MDFRRVLSILIAVPVLLVGCAAPGGGVGAKGPIKIGLLAPVSGAFAANGQDMVRGWELWWKRHGNKVAGREVQWFHEDTASNPDVALNKARLLVEQRGVHMLAAPGLLASEGLAVAGYLKGTDFPVFMPVVSADDLTQRQRAPNIVRVAGWTSSQVHHPFGEWACKQGYKTIVTLGNDYAFGHEVVGGFVNTYTDAGCKVLEQLWDPLTEQDFSPYIARIQALKPDAVFAIQVGASATRFLQAWSQFGLKDKIPLLAGETTVDQSNIRGLQNPEIVVGIVSAGHYAEGRESPATQEFVKAYMEAYGDIPSYYAAAMYTAAQWLTQAMEAVQGNVEDRKAFLEAVRKVELKDSPFGPERLDEYNNPILNVYIRKVVKRPDGRVWNVVLETIPNVSQFWKWSPEEFLKRPVYSRDYQPGFNPKK